MQLAHDVSWSLTTHLPLWHASPRQAYEAINAEGIALVREYVWCSDYPLLPIQFAQQHRGDFILSWILLPRGKEDYLWGRTRGEPGGDPQERTFDYGGRGNEVKVWNAIPRAYLQEILSAEEVMERLKVREGESETHRAGSVFQRTRLYSGRTCYHCWFPDADAFEQECLALFEHPATDCETRILAGLYLHTMGQFPPRALTTQSWQMLILDSLLDGEEPADDVLASACRLLAHDGSRWLPTLTLCLGERNISQTRLAKLIALACITHSELEIETFIDDTRALNEATRFIVHALVRLLVSAGQDTSVIQQLASGGELSASLFVLLLYHWSGWYYHTVNTVAAKTRCAQSCSQRYRARSYGPPGRG